MNRSRVLTARNLVSFLLMSTVMVSAVAQEAKPPVRPQEPTVDCRQAFFGGTVTEVTKMSISIRWGDDKKDKTFSVSATLAAGKIAMKPRQMVIPGRRFVPDSFLPPIYLYRLTDVKVGDLVAIIYAHLGEENICDHIRICKRPGGRVPPLPEEAEKLLNPVEIMKAKFPETFQQWKEEHKDLVYIPYHEKMNAYWDLEDKGIPYPEKFGRDRRFPVAPMPRKLTVETPRIIS